MKIPQFELERYFAKYEFSSPYLLGCSDCESFSVQEILGLEQGAEDAFQKLWLGYTESLGHPTLREQISNLYEATNADQLLVYAGAEEAIFAFMNVMLDRGDHVVVHYPAYQSLFEVARAIGCELTLWQGAEEQNFGCYEALKQLGRRIPTDVSVVGFDDEEIASHVMPKLTTLRFPRHLMGVWAAERALSGPRVVGEIHRITKLECELVERDSVAVDDLLVKPRQRRVEGAAESQS